MEVGGGVFTVVGSLLLRKRILGSSDRVILCSSEDSIYPIGPLNIPTFC